MSERHPGWSAIEPDVTRQTSETDSSLFVYRPGEHAIELSKAISLKRIADTLDGLARGEVRLGNLSNDLNGLAYDAGRNFHLGASGS